MKNIVWIALLMTCTATNGANADFERELARLDSTFFQKSFNECDFEYLERTVGPDLVFFHDQSGMQDADTFKKLSRENICGGGALKPIRRLFPGSLQSWPLYDDGELYGAIQMGRHAFYLRASSGEETLTSTASFTHTWARRDGSWVLTHVLSYDHTNPGVEESELLSAMSSAHVPALAVGIVENGAVTRSSVIGTLDGQRPAPGDTLFKVASLTKPIVTMTALKLVHAGELSLDEPLARYWIDPDLEHDERVHDLTVRHVLMHQTGFPNWRWMSEDKTLAFDFTPGEGFAYSGEGYEYLRQALEARFDTSLEALAERLVFKPAGMTDTHFWWDSKVSEYRYAQHHDSAGRRYELQKYYEANAAANVITTIDDYSRFMAFVLNQRNVMPDLYDLMTRKSQKLRDNRFFGLGWEILDGGSMIEPAILHSGRDPGVSTLAVFFPESEQAFVVFMNGDNAGPVFAEILPNLYQGPEIWARK